MLYFTVRTLVELNPDIIPFGWVEPENTATNVKDAIMDVCGDLACIYRDPNIFKREVRIWFFKNLDTWKRLAETAHFEYNPISNYDRRETITDTASENSVGTNNTKSTNTEKVSAFNSDNMSEKQSGNFDGTTSGSVTANRTNTRTAEISGNIGVTTTQEMIKQERDVLNFNIYDIIAHQFKERFCIMVY